MTGHTEFRWYASADAEVYTIGEEPSREAVISRARSEELGREKDEDGKPRLFFYIVEASKFDLRIADHAVPRDAEDLFETIEDSAADWNFGNPDNDAALFECSDELKTDLHARLRATCEQWQADHNLSWRSWSFAIGRNEETIVIPLDETGGDA